MTAFVSIFGGSLFCIALFFTFKDWERERGDTRVTSFLKTHSPKAEYLFKTVVARIVFVVTAFFATMSALVRFGIHNTIVFVRAGVVVVAAHMVQVVRGEKLIAEGKIPSTYFKLLHRHKEKINGTDIPEGIAKPDVLRRVKVHMNDIPSSAEPLSQVE